MLYNVPGRTGQDIPDEVVLSLAESHPDSFLGESSKKEKKKEKRREEKERKNKRKKPVKRKNSTFPPPKKKPPHPRSSRRQRVHGQRQDRRLRLPRRPLLVRQRRRGARCPAPGGRHLGRRRRLGRLESDPKRFRETDGRARRRVGHRDGPAYRLAVRGAEPDRAEHGAGDVRAVQARV